MAICEHAGFSEYLQIDILGIGYFLDYDGFR